MAKRTLTTSDGFSLGAYDAMPSSSHKASIVVIQEIFGVNKHIREVVDDYAAQGYYAIAPQIFDRVERDVELGYSDQAEFDKGRKIAFEGLNMEDTLKDLQAAAKAAGEHGDVGVVGYCFGGLLTWLAACEIDGLKAASAYYGGGIANEVGRSAKCPVMMHFGEKDAHIPMSDVEKIRDAQPNVAVFTYDADHGFNCDHRASYGPTSAATAKQRTLVFFDRHLGDDDATVRA